MLSFVSRFMEIINVNYKTLLKRIILIVSSMIDLIFDLLKTLYEYIYIIRN